jgi:Rrf2 family protein
MTKRLKMFSKACEYGIKAIVYIATQSLDGHRSKIGDIINHVGSPEAFTAKILGALTKHDIVRSQTGPYGGFEIELSRMKAIRLSEIVFALDGEALYSGCGLGLSKCSDRHPCPIHHKFIKVRSQLKEMLETTTIYDLAIGLKTGKSILI